MLPPRKRKMPQSRPTTTTFSIGDCIVEFPSDADHEITHERLTLQVNQFASITINVDKLKTHVCEKSHVSEKIHISETTSPCILGDTLPSDISFQIINPKSLDKINQELLESTTQLYKQELPAMNFAADTGKESDFLRNCTMSGKYCSLILKKPGSSPADPELVVGAITYQILPTSTQYAEIPLAAVDQSSQRQGLGKLLVRELARRLTDVGVLTLFCWGDQESEQFWNKQGFKKIAGVDAQGKPQKLRLKNEIRKSMSLPGNSSLMVCNLPYMNTPSTRVAGNSPQSPRPEFVTPTTVKEVKTGCKTAHAGAEQSPRASCDVLDPYSFGNDSPEASFLSLKNPSLAVASTPNRNSGIANSKVKTYVTRSKSAFPATTNPISGSMSSPAMSNLNVRFAETDSVAATERGISENTPSVFSGGLVTMAACGNSERGISGNTPSVFPGELVTIAACGNSGAVGKSCTQRVRVQNVSATFSIDNPPSTGVESKGGLGDMQNIREQDVMAPLKKRLCERPLFDNLKAVTAVDGSQPSDIGCVHDKENKDPVRNESSGTEREGTVPPLKTTLKRPRAESPPVRALRRRSERKHLCENPSIVNPVLQTPDPQLPGHASISEQLSTAQMVESANPVFQAPELQVSEPPSVSPCVLTPKEVGVAEPATQTPELQVLSLATFSDWLPTTEKVGTSNHVLVPNRQTGSTARDVLAMDCKQAEVDGSFSPSRLGEEYLDLRLQNQRKDSTIRKRSSSRLVLQPVIGEESPLVSGYPKDFAKVDTPVVFFMNLHNDSKKRASAQFGKLVEKLGGKVTGDGGECTHVVTSEVRRTLNFCSALCKGAWVVTPDWLKASSRSKSFVEEESYVLRDKQFELKYKVSLATSIQAAQRKPGSLLAGYFVYSTPHVQPPLEIVTKLTKVAGGKIHSSLDEALQQSDALHTIVLTGDEDEEEIDVASKAGLRTFPGEWLMQAMVRQRVDFAYDC